MNKGLLVVLSGFFLCGLGFENSAQAEVKLSCLDKVPGVTIKGSGDAYLRINYLMQFYGQWRDTGSGPDGTKSTSDFYFRRNRLSFTGQATKTLGYAITLEHGGARSIGPIDVVDDPVSILYVLDAFAMMDFSEGFKMTVGRQKVPFVREVQEKCFSQVSVDRSLFINTSSRLTRDEGLLFWGNLLNKKVQYKLAIMDGYESASNPTTPESSFRYTARAHLALLDPEDGFNYSGTYLGDKMIFTIGGGYQYEPGAVFSDAAATDGKDYTAYTADVFLEFPLSTNGTVTASGAYLLTDFDDAYLGSSPDPESVGLNGQKDGWYAKAAYLQRSTSGPGGIQPYVRYEQWNFAELNAVNNQKIDWIAGGLNFLINGEAARVSLEYASTDFDNETVDQDFVTMTTMLQLAF